VNKKKLLKAIIQSRGKNVLFADFIVILETFGFCLDRVNGSHYIYIHKAGKHLISVQSDGKDAKPYQVKQFIKIIEQFNLKMEE
jgi:predicted RNA binding protein YcfA (HicA-like mRNA interferase family)